MVRHLESLPISSFSSTLQTFVSFLADSNLLVNHQTFYMDLTKANQRGFAEMTQLYDAKTDLGLEDLSPKSWYNYVQKMAGDDTAFAQFRRHFYRKGPAMNAKCDEFCKQNLLCDLLTSEAQLVHKPKVCQKFKVNVYKWMSSLFNSQY